MRLVSLIALLTLIPSDGSTNSGNINILSNTIDSSIDANEQHVEQKSSFEAETEDLVKRDLYHNTNVRRKRPRPRRQKGNGVVGTKGAKKGVGGKGIVGTKGAKRGVGGNGVVGNRGAKKGVGFKGGKGIKGGKGGKGGGKGCDATNEGRRLKGYKGKDSKGKGSKGKGSKGKGSKGKDSKGKGSKGKDSKGKGAKGKGSKGKGYKDSYYGYDDSYYGYDDSYYGYGKGKGVGYYGYGKGNGKGSGYYDYYSKGKGSGYYDYYSKGKGADYYNYGKGKGADYYGTGKGKGSDYYYGTGKGKGSDYYYGTGKGKGSDYYYGTGKGKGSDYYYGTGKGKGADYYNAGKGKGCGDEFVKVTNPVLVDKEVTNPTPNPVIVVKAPTPPKNTPPPFSPISNDSLPKSKKSKSKSSKSQSSKSESSKNGTNTKGKSNNGLFACKKEGNEGAEPVSMRFKYTIQTTDEANTRDKRRTIVDEIEREIAELMEAGVCNNNKSPKSPKARRSLETSDVISPYRRLAIVGMDSQAHTVEESSACSAESCLVSADMTLMTDEEDSDKEMCEFHKAIQKNLNELNPASVTGLKSARYVSSDSANNCGFKDTRVDGVAFAQQNESNMSESNDNIFHKFFWPLLILLLLLICCCGYVRMRRSANGYDSDDEFDKNTVSSVDGDIIDKDSIKSMNYTEKQRFLSSVDVKMCPSLACNTCNTSKSTQFVRTASSSPQTPSTVGTSSPGQFT